MTPLRFSKELSFDEQISIALNCTLHLRQPKKSRPCVMFLANQPLDTETEASCKVVCVSK